MLSARDRAASGSRYQRIAWARLLFQTVHEDITDHIRGRIREHGDDRDLANLEAAEQELAERHARKGGRPPKAT